MYAMTPFTNCILEQFSTEGQVIDLHYNYYRISLPAPAVSVAVLSSAVLSIIGTTLITGLVWCCAVLR